MKKRGRPKKKVSGARKIGAKARQFLRSNAGSGASTSDFRLILPDGRDVEFFQPKKGSNLIDIIPYRVSIPDHPFQEKGGLWYQKTIAVHFGIGVDEQAYHCPKEMLGKPCPICEEIARIRKEKPRDEARELINPLRPRIRELYNVLDLNNPDKGIQLWEISWHNFGKTLQEEIEEVDDPDWFFADPDDGASLKVRFSEAKIGSNSYLEATRIDFIERDEAIPDELIDQAYDLDKIVKILDYKTLARIFLEIDDVAEDEEDEGENRAPISIRGKKSKVADDEDEDEEEEEEEEENGEDDEDGENDNGGEDEEEEEEEEEEPEPKPKKRGRPPKKKEKEPPAKGKKKAKKDKCPYGHKFGVDTDEYEDCEDCPLWEDCLEEQEKNTED